MREQEHQFREDVERAVLPHLHHFSKLNRGAAVSTSEEDTKLSFDMRVGLWVPVSVRLRSGAYFDRYRDFSIRSKTRYSGQIVNGQLVECELEKLKRGLGNCYFYGWLNESESSVANYILVDMNKFRSHLDRGIDKPNNDGATWGRYFDLDLIASVGALVHQSWDDYEGAA